MTEFISVWSLKPGVGRSVRSYGHVCSELAGRSARPVRFNIFVLESKASAASV